MGLHQGARSERRRKSRGSQLGQHSGDPQLRRERIRNPQRGIAPLQVRLRSSLLRRRWLRVQRGDRVESQRGGEPAVADLAARSVQLLVHPSELPPAVLALERQKRREVALHAQADRRARKHAHGEGRGVAGAACALEYACAQERREARVQRRVGSAAQEPCRKEEEAFGRFVVPRAVQVGAMLEQAE